ncbi:tetratricopeptide repeat protein [Oceanihabitans sp. IOP_32]|uniref:tetratricopeptide repeat protein n=1 Tax=Oceanihabitans sp. IOP_32 TaxID=2529032 RepID=UPI001293D8D1|nr:tetratricopeptide repeat protein [Oceanihabitans sp. IOP_32]QFZ54204.1 tetratricopeptide repeat protein [Oceanihabitans sp. IOP_32]
MKTAAYLLLFLCSTLVFSQNDKLFEQGNALYNQGKYAEAIEKYTAILDSGNHSEALYFNLANAHYKLNNIAPSIYFYEKALLLAPQDKTIQNNMAFAKNMTIDAIDVVPQTGLSKFIKSFTNIMSFDSWAKTSIVFVLCFVALFLIYYFAYSSFNKRLAFIGSFISLVLVLLSLAFTFHKFNSDKNNRPAIVFAQESEVKNEPNLRSEIAFRLHEGTKVQVLDTLNNWKKIKLADGKTGWIDSADIKLLNDFSY